MARQSSGLARAVVCTLPGTRFQPSPSSVTLVRRSDLPKRFYFGSKQLDRHLGKLICRIDNHEAFSLVQIGLRFAKRTFKPLYLYL